MDIILNMLFISYIFYAGALSVLFEDKDMPKYKNRIHHQLMKFVLVMTWPIWFIIVAMVKFTKWVRSKCLT